MFNLRGPEGQTRGQLLVRGPQFEKHWYRGWRWLANGCGVGAGVGGHGGLARLFVTDRWWSVEVRQHSC
jgi:hypothetical protein